MRRSLVLKLGTVGVLIVLILVGLAWIDSLVGERQARRDEVVRDIQRSSTSDQQLTAPLLVVPYQKTQKGWVEDPDTKERRFEERRVAGELRFLPETLKLDGQMQTERRARGIYQTRLYHARVRLAGTFELPANAGIDSDLSAYQFGQPFIAVGVTDIRGIEQISTLDVSGTAVKFAAGTGTTLLSAGVHAILPPVPLDAPSHLSFSWEMSIEGTGQLQITPVGRQTRVTLTSNWPNPNFVGDYLPTQHQIDPRGFSAIWETSFFSTNLEEVLRNCSQTPTCAAFTGLHFGVTLADPVDQYLESDRSIKYALLFILPTFAGFFLFEVLQSLAVHPIQYGLAGAALAVFYLLLLSLSEHIGFALAYLASSSACVALIGFYVCHVLRSVRRGLGFAAGLSTLYAFLYAILGAEDYALLAGSLLVFGLLAAVMIMTRRVNWSDLDIQRRPS